MTQVKRLLVLGEENSIRVVSELLVTDLMPKFLPKESFPIIFEKNSSDKLKFKKPLTILLDDFI